MIVIVMLHVQMRMETLTVLATRGMKEMEQIAQVCYSDCLQIIMLPLDENIYLQHFGRHTCYHHIFSFYMMN